MIEEEYSPYWETNEFEDLVTRSLIAMYETKIKIQKRSLPATRLSPELIQSVRRLGCYFPSNDRVIETNPNSTGDKLAKIQIYDILNNGLPQKAIWTMDAENKYNAYLATYYIEKIPVIPKPFLPQFEGKKYKLAAIFFENEIITGTVDYFTIRNDGAIGSCYRIYEGTNPRTGQHYRLKEHAKPDTTNHATEDFVAGWATAVLQVYQDRLHLWNVRAIEGAAKATFAVHPEQIKSLFYSRDLPMTETGRKRPILHWVKAHQRRMKEGLEYDVDKYLRGTHEFVYNNTKFEIINPIKNK